MRGHLLKPSSDEQQEFCDSKRYYTLEPTRAQDLSGFPTKTVETEQKWCRCYGEETQVFLLPANTFLSALHTHSQDGTLPSFPDNLHHSRWMKGPHSRVLKNIMIIMGEHVKPPSNREASTRLNSWTCRSLKTFSLLPSAHCTQRAGIQQQITDLLMGLECSSRL